MPAVFSAESNRSSNNNNVNVVAKKQAVRVRIIWLAVPLPLFTEYKKFLCSEGEETWTNVCLHIVDMCMHAVRVHVAQYK